MMIRKIIAVSLLLGISCVLNAMDSQLAYYQLRPISVDYHKKKKLCTYTQHDLERFQQRLAPYNKQFLYKKPDVLFNLNNEIAFSFRMLTLRAEFEELNEAIKDYFHLSICNVTAPQRYQHQQALEKAERLVIEMLNRYSAHAHQLQQVKERLQCNDSETHFIQWCLKLAQKRREYLERAQTFKAYTLDLFNNSREQQALLQQPYDIFQPINGRTILSHLVVMGATKEIKALLFGDKYTKETIDEARKRLLEKMHKDTKLACKRKDFVASHEKLSLLTHNDLAGNAGFINEYNPDGSTALHLACQQSRVEITRMLLKAGADVMLYDKEGYLPFHRALLAGDLEHVVLFLYLDGFDSTTPTKGGTSPLELAVKKATPEVVQALLSTKKGEELLQAPYDVPLLFQAVERGNLAVVKVLLEHGENVAHKDRQGRSASNFALTRKKKNLPIIIELLRHDISFGKIEWTPSHVKTLQDLLACKALEGAQLEVAEYLQELLTYAQGLLQMKRLDKEIEAKYEEERAQRREQLTEFFELKRQKRLLEAQQQRTLRQQTKAEAQEPGGPVENLRSINNPTQEQLTYINQLLSCIRNNNVAKLRKLCAQKKYKECINVQDANELTLLHHAVMKGDHLIVAELCKQGADVKSFVGSTSKENLFYIAILTDNVRILDILLSAVNLSGRELYMRLGFLFYAGRYHAVGCLKVMIEKHEGASFISTRTFEGRTVLDYVEDESILRYLEERFEGPGAQILRPENEQKKVEAFFDAISSGNVEQVQQHVSADPKCITWRDLEGNTPLHIAAREGRHELVRYLLSMGADKRARMPLHSYRGYEMPIDAALSNFPGDVIMYDQKCTEEIARYLGIIDDLVDEDHKKGVMKLKKMIIFINFIYRGDLLNMQKMIDNKEVDFSWTNTTYTEVEESLLHVAAHFGHHEVVKMLKDVGFDMDMRDEFGDNALVTVFYDDSDPAMIDTLLDVGVSPQGEDKDGRTLLWSFDCAHSVDEQAVISIIGKLIEAGLNVSHQDTFGDTILHFMCEKIDQDYPEIFEHILRRCPALMDVRNTDGKTIRDLIDEAGREAYNKILVKYEGEIIEL